MPPYDLLEAPPATPTVPVEETTDAPVTQLRPAELQALGQRLEALFRTYASERRLAEQKWLKNLRQYLGQYDPEILSSLTGQRSKAYPRITRVKCISVLSRIMNLMFPGNERNWELQASPNAEMAPQDVMQVVERLVLEREQQGMNAEVTDALVQAAVQELATERAATLSTLIDDQLQELGGDQTMDYIALNRRVAQSGIMYGIGLARGPFVRKVTRSAWTMGPDGQPTVTEKTSYKPLFEFLPVWDFYPDMSAKSINGIDGYFTRVVMSRAQVRELGRRSDFFEAQIQQYLARNTSGNYRPQPFETELRNMGSKAEVLEQKTESPKYEVIVWNGPIGANELEAAGIAVPEDKRGDDMDVEIWMLDGVVIKAALNPWRALGTNVRMIHAFLFDEDDTSPVGSGLPAVMRDSQMSVAAASRMLLDNASVICGPNLEVNMDLLMAGQDVSGTSAYKVWYREGTGLEAQSAAVRNIQIDGHLNDLIQIIDLFMRFADMETFVGPATGGDVAKTPSEPMRTAVGASMMRGDAALPFKDIVRNHDAFTQSVIQSLVQFNRKFNPSEASAGDYNVVARGATSLIAKEVRGMQVDQLAATLTPDERVHIDERKLVEARLAVRDLSNLMVSKEEASQRMASATQSQDEQQQLQNKLIEAQVRKTLADAFKAIAQGQKNSANADASAVDSALKLLEAGMQQAIAEDAGVTPTIPEPTPAPAPMPAQPAPTDATGTGMQTFAPQGMSGGMA